MATTPNGFLVITDREDCVEYEIQDGLTLPLRGGDCG